MARCEFLHSVSLVMVININICGFATQQNKGRIFNIQDRNSVRYFAFRGYTRKARTTLCIKGMVVGVCLGRSCVEQTTGLRGDIRVWWLQEGQEYPRKRCGRSQTNSTKKGLRQFLQKEVRPNRFLPHSSIVLRPPSCLAPATPRCAFSTNLRNH